MSQFSGNATPSIGPIGTATPRNILSSSDGALYLASGIVLDGSKCRDTGNTNDVQTLRCGMLLGRITGSSLFACSFLGNTTAAYDGGTTVTTSAAVATELVRRIGTSGTLKLIGPPTASGTVRTQTLTYSGANTSTGAITVTALSTAATYTLTEQAGTDGGTFALVVTTPDGVSTSTAGLAYNETSANIQTALQALVNVGSGNATVSGSAGGPYTVTFSSTLGAVTLRTANDSTNDGGVFEGGIVVAQTQAGNDGRFVSSSFVAPTDGSESPMTIQGDQWGITVTDIYQNNINAQLGLALVGGQIFAQNLIYWPASVPLQNWLLAQLKAIGFGYVNQNAFIS